MKKLFRLNDLSSSFRFTVPVIAENLFTSLIGLVFSSILGGISASSLAAAGIGNQILSFVSALFSIATTGTSVLVALNTGKGKPAQTSRVVEQSILLVPVISVSIAFFMYLVSSPVIRVLMPGADEEFYREGLDYFRMLLLSLPGLMATNTFSSILRSSGDSRSALICTVFSNAVQILSAILFISVLDLGIAGAGLAYVTCRYASSAALLWAVKRHDRHFMIRIRNALSPDKTIIREIIRIGLPSVVDGIAVQGGYVLINSLLVNLGKDVAGIYNVIAALIGFTGISQAIVSTSVTTIAGHKIGAGQLSQARKSYARLL
ncbi:MAG: polysaccharide biosynthesis C-terminal domain-containing protein, partial [Clostridia bacterium]|nr:polysaccharide biosynthesis C-terminal domain-containing protein [Clostridia bacterium]